MIPALDELLTDKDWIAIARKQFGIDIPDDATRIKLSDQRDYERVGEVKKMVPVRTRWSWWPTYIEVVEGIYTTWGYLTWWVDDKRFGAKVVLR